MRNKNEIKEKFERDGFVVFSPNDLLETDVLRKLQVKANEILPDYSEAKVDPSTNNSHFDPRFKIGYDFSESIMLYGCALRHRATRGRGSIENIKDDNRHRDALILNFSKHSDREFGKEYLENIAYKEKIRPHFKNESLVSHIGVKVNR